MLIPDLLKTEGVGVGHHLALRSSAQFRGGVAVGSRKVGMLLQLYGDALDYLRGRDMVDPTKAAVFGTSYGASLALALAAQDTRLAAVALAYPMPGPAARPREARHGPAPLRRRHRGPLGREGARPAPRRLLHGKGLVRARRGSGSSSQLPRPGPLRLRGRPRGVRVDPDRRVPQAKPESSASETPRDATETRGLSSGSGSGTQARGLRAHPRAGSQSSVGSRVPASSSDGGRLIPSPGFRVRWGLSRRSRPIPSRRA